VLWFGRKKQYEKLRDELETRIAIEVPEHQRAKQEAVNEAKRATEGLKETITRNGFTLKVHIAAGGKR
jgi:hypothetical protein